MLLKMIQALRQDRLLRGGYRP